MLCQLRVIYKGCSAAYDDDASGAHQEHLSWHLPSPALPAHRFHIFGITLALSPPSQSFRFFLELPTCGASRGVAELPSRLHNWVNTRTRLPRLQTAVQLFLYFLKVSAAALYYQKPTHFHPLFFHPLSTSSSATYLAAPHKVHLHFSSCFPPFS